MEELEERRVSARWLARHGRKATPIDVSVAGLLIGESTIPFVSPLEQEPMLSHSASLSESTVVQLRSTHRDLLTRRPGMPRFIHRIANSAGSYKNMCTHLYAVNIKNTEGGTLTHLMCCVDLRDPHGLPPRRTSLPLAPKPV